MVHHDAQWETEIGEVIEREKEKEEEKILIYRRITVNKKEGIGLEKKHYFAIPV